MSSARGAARFWTREDEGGAGETEASVSDLFLFLLQQPQRARRDVSTGAGARERKFQARFFETFLVACKNSAQVALFFFFLPYP